MVVDNKATVTYVQLLKEDLLVKRIVPKDGPVPDYEAGQFLTLGLPNPLDGGKIVRRAYSIASHPENKEYIEFVIRWVRKPLPGRLTTQLFNVKEGDEILWLKPLVKHYQSAKNYQMAKKTQEELSALAVEPIGTICQFCTASS